MISFLPSLLALAAIFTSLAQAQYDSQLVGTWTTKSKKVLTGPGFYDPVADKLIEPERTGISYSFTADGWYEEAFYRAISNPTQPQCPSGIMQWQHGRYALASNGSLKLQPIAVDGRQLTSTPCSYATSLYIRYHQPEFFLKYAVYMDPYHNVQRLDLYQFDGSPMNPMFLQYRPPQMLPTQTLNPTASATGAAATKTPSRFKKRGVGGHFDGEQYHIENPNGKKNAGIISKDPDSFDADYLWYMGIGMIGIGSVMYMIPTSRSRQRA